MLVRLVTVLVIHGIVLVAPRPVRAQAEPAPAVFIALGRAVLLEGRGSNPLSSTGQSLSVEAGVRFAQGSAHVLESGVRATRTEGSPSWSGSYEASSLGGFFGAALPLGPPHLEPRTLVPSIRGGLEIASTTDRVATRARIQPPDTKAVAFGPYLALGLVKEVFPGASLELAVTAHSRIAPFTLALGGALAVRAEL